MTPPEWHLLKPQDIEIIKKGDASDKLIVQTNSTLRDLAHVH
jgi:hypothetical protein